MYQLTVTGQQGAVQHPEFAVARAAADQLTQSDHVEVQVIHVLTGALAYQTSPHPAAQGVGEFDPWTRIERVPATWMPLAIEGYTLAYSRKRIQTAVYRPNVPGQGWLVDNFLTKERVEVPTTKAACAVTKRMGQQARGV